MKTLSLWQPWASLIAYGLKHYETRDWAPPAWLVGQRLAIHATIARPEMSYQLGQAIGRACGWRELAFPNGAVVATCRLLGVYQAVSYDHTRRLVFVGSTLRGSQPVPLPNPEWTCLPAIYLPGEQREFGDYSKGRWLWWLGEVRPLEPPAPARGHQKLWDWRPADELARAL